MGKKAEARERRKEKNREILKVTWCALGVALFFDMLILFIDLLSSAWTVAAYAFLAACVILPINICLAVENMDGPSFWPFF